LQEMIASIISNFKAQQELYLRMSEMAKMQLTCLEQQCPEETASLSELLQGRQELMQEIDGLNKQNQTWQEQVAVQLELPEFSLSQLESKIEKGLHDSLHEVLDSLRELLADITATDEQNHALLKKNARPARAENPVSRQKAQNAYQQAARQSKKKNDTPS